MKKQVNVRLQPIYVDMLNSMQKFYNSNGYNYSQADVIEIALNNLEYFIRTGLMTDDLEHFLRTGVMRHES